MTTVPIDPTAMAPPGPDPTVGAGLGSMINALQGLPVATPSGTDATVDLPSAASAPALDRVVGSATPAASVYGIDRQDLPAYQQIRTQYPALFGEVDEYGAQYPRDAGQQPQPVDTATQPSTPHDFTSVQAGDVLRARSVDGVAASLGMTHPTQVGLFRSLADQYALLPSHAGSHPVTALGWELNKWSAAADKGVLPKADLSLWAKVRAGHATGAELGQVQTRMVQFAQDTGFVADPHLAVHPVLALSKVVPQKDGTNLLVFTHRDFPNDTDLTDQKATAPRQDRLGRLDMRALTPVMADNVKRTIGLATDVEKEAASGWYQEHGAPVAEQQLLSTVDPERRRQIEGGSDLLNVMFRSGTAPKGSTSTPRLDISEPAAWTSPTVDPAAHDAALGMALPPGPQSPVVGDMYRAAALDLGMAPAEAQMLSSIVWQRMLAEYHAAQGTGRTVQLGDGTEMPSAPADKIPVADDRVLRLIQGEGDLAPHQVAASIPRADMLVPAGTLRGRTVPEGGGQLTVVSNPSTGEQTVIAPPTADNLGAMGSAYPTPYLDGRAFLDGKARPWSNVWQPRFAAPVDDVHSEYDRIHTEENRDKPQATELRAQPAESLPALQGRHAIIVNGLNDLGEGTDKGVQGSSLAVHNAVLRQLTTEGVQPADATILNPHQANTPAGETTRQSLVMHFDKSADVKHAWAVVSDFADRYNEPVIDRRAYVFGTNETPPGTVPLLEHHFQGPDGSTLTHLQKGGSTLAPHTVQTWVQPEYADSLHNGPPRANTIDRGADGQTATYNGAVRIVDGGQGSSVRLKPSSLLDTTRDGRKVSKMSIWVPPTGDIPVMAFAEPDLLVRRNPAATPDRILTGDIRGGRVNLTAPATPGPTGEGVFNLSMFERARQALTRAGAAEVTPTV